MEFQFFSGFPTPQQDGQFCPLTDKKLAAHRKSSPPPTGRVIVVDLINNRLRAFRNGTKDLDFKPIRGGSASDPSKRDVFKVVRALRHHTRSKFPIPPGNMDFSLFYNGGEALHQGPPDADSHGCIHVEPSEAERLFNWAGGEKSAVTNDVMVIVLKFTA